jgi:hypothetical protein
MGKVLPSSALFTVDPHLLFYASGSSILVKQRKVFYHDATAAGLRQINRNSAKAYRFKCMRA